MTDGPATEDVRVAGTWHRLAAGAVDLVAILGVTAGLTALVVVFPPSRWNLIDRVADLVTQHTATAALPLALLAVVSVVWHVLFARLLGATPGERLMRLRPVDLEGARPAVGRLLLHSALRVSSAALLGFGHLWAVVDNERRTLYDRVARVYVIRSPRAPHVPRAGDIDQPGSEV